MGFTPVSPTPGARYTELRGTERNPADPSGCRGGVAGTRWIWFRVESSLRVELSVESAEVNAVTAAYRTPPEDPAVMPCVQAQANQGPASGSFPAVAGVDYLVMVAAAGGGSGKVLLRWRGQEEEVVLGEPEPGFLPDGRVRIRWPHLPAGDYELRASDDLPQWHWGFETNVISGVIEYVDPDLPLGRARFYHLRQMSR